jgi:hypothetical protein
MGRTIATFRQLIEQELANWERVFGRALRREERAHLEAMFNRVRIPGKRHGRDQRGHRARPRDAPARDRSAFED